MLSLGRHVIPKILPLLVWTFLTTLFCFSPTIAATNREILWNTISTCIDTTDKDYCSRCNSPRVEIDCHTCRNTTEVWAESTEFVAIRDRKMCDCPEGFVHGLVIPRSRVTGVEDPLRPDGIWKFAWETATKRLKENEIALVVNPKLDRSQDQLHVHMVRVRQDRRPSSSLQSVIVDSLDKVWYAAARKAAEFGWKDYGVLVTKAAETGYLVLVEHGSPEDRYTQARCR